MVSFGYKAGVPSGFETLIVRTCNSLLTACFTGEKLDANRNRDSD